MDDDDRLRYPMKGITNPGIHDLLLGRGGEVNSHSGNVYFRSLINEYKGRYRAASRVDKPRVAAEVVAHWRRLDPPGRFLTRSNPGEAGYIWQDIGDSAAKRRASKALGERDYKAKEKASDLPAIGACPSSSLDSSQGIVMAGTPSIAQPIENIPRIYEEIRSQGSAIQTLFSDQPISRQPNEAPSATLGAPNNRKIFAGPTPSHVSSSPYIAPVISQARPSRATGMSFNIEVGTRSSAVGSQIHLENRLAQSLLSLIRQQEQQVAETNLTASSGTNWSSSMDPDSLPTAAALTKNAFNSSDSSGEGDDDPHAATLKKSSSSSDSSMEDAFASNG